MAEKRKERPMFISVDFYLLEIISEACQIFKLIFKNLDLVYFYYLAHITPFTAFHEKMGEIKDRNGMDLTEAENIKKRWQEYREELYKKDLNDPDNHDGVITHLEPDILDAKSCGP